jgi:ABC-type Co2+ transport system permease subunit
MSFQLWHIILTAIVLLFLGGLVGGWIAIFGSVVKASKMASRGISTLLEEAADQIIAAPPQQWAVWCLHLLKAVDIRVADQEYRSALNAIQADISVRLDTGSWPRPQIQANAETSGSSGAALA